ncbi:MAG TPA: hypothetical protein VHB98_16070, partial [Chloroflexota bacterium]|nr:hypothetical protein [Chloroflexota bacterium]
MERGEHTRVTPAERQLEARMAGAAGDRAPRGQPIMPATWAQADGASRLARAGYHGLILLALVLPFEFTQRPLLSTSFLTITNVKVVLYAVAALAAVSLAQYGKAAARDADLRRAWRPLRIPLALFAGLLLCFLLSSAMARERADGLKWTSDLLVGGLLWAVTPLWLAQERERKIRAIARAIVVGAVIAATAGILEYILGAGFAADLSWFKPKPTLAGAFLRLSGTFQYANIAAMYMEMALPFAVAGLIEALARPHRRWVPVLAWILAVEVLLEALLLTFSRGALLGLAVAAGVTLLIVRRLRPRRSLAPRQRLALGATAGLAVLLAAITIASTPLALLRFTSQSDQEWYRADYVSRVPATMLACQQLTVPVTVENHSPFLWQQQGPDLYNLGYHWLYASGTVAIFENPRSRLQGPVPPGAAQTISAHIQAPPRAGRYLLVWDMVQENVTWFSLKRAAYVGLPVLVRQGPSPRGAVCAGHARRAVAHGDGPAELPRSFSQPGRTQLW